MSRHPSGRTCSCGCAVRDPVVRPSVALHPAPRPYPTTPPTTEARRRPVSRDCVCRVCRPGRDGHDRDGTAGVVVRDVRRAGWHLAAVGAGGSGEPGYAHTVGLAHRSGHPELLVSGQPVDLAAAVLDDVAHRVVVEGRRLAPGDVVEGALAWHPLVVDEVTPSAASQTLRLASWFHRRPARALQLVWPDAQGLFPWQPGAHDTTDLQPPAWRRPAERLGGTAADPGWQLGTPSDHLAAACSHVVLRGASPMTVLRSRRTERAQWVLVCGRHDDEHDRDEDWTHQHLAHAVRGTPSLRQVDLAPGEGATRRGPSDPWRRFRLS